MEFPGIDCAHEEFSAFHRNHGAWRGAMTSLRVVRNRIARAVDYATTNSGEAEDSKIGKPKGIRIDNNAERRVKKDI